MSYEVGKIRAIPGIISDGGALTAEFQVTNVGAGSFWLAVKVDSVAGGGPVYATGVVEGQFINDTWEPLVAVELEDVVAAGVFKFYATALTGLVPPKCRLVLTSVAGQTVEVSEIRQGVWGPDDGTPGRVPSPTGGAFAVTIADPIGPNLAADSVSVTWATDDKGQKTAAESVSVVVASDEKGEKVMAESISQTLATDDRKAARQLDVGDTYTEDHTVDNITNAWRTIFTTTSEILYIDIFDSSGVTYELGWGGSRKALVPPGGYTGQIKIPLGTDVQIKTLSGTISGGRMDVNTGKP